jgi:hypothetical protein
MRAAAAQVAVKRFDDLLVVGLGVGDQQRLGRHDDAVDAIAALHRLLVNKGLLQPARRFG